MKTVSLIPKSGPVPPFPKENKSYLDVEFGFGGADICYGGYVSGTAILEN